MNEKSDFLYGGITGVKLPVETFDLGEGLELRQTYCHLFSTNMMAFARPKEESHHPGPWKPARGGFAFDIEIELRVPNKTSLGDSFDAKDLIWWISALLRMTNYPFLSVPITSDISFQEIPQSAKEPDLAPFESERKFMRRLHEDGDIVRLYDLQWVAHKWQRVGNR